MSSLQYVICFANPSVLARYALRISIGSPVLFLDQINACIEAELNEINVYLSGE